MESGLGSGRLWELCNSLEENIRFVFDACPAQRGGTRDEHADETRRCQNPSGRIGSGLRQKPQRRSGCAGVALSGAADDALWVLDFRRRRLHERDPGQPGGDNQQGCFAPAAPVLCRQPMDEEVGALRRVDAEAVGTIGFVTPSILWPPPGGQHGTSPEGSLCPNVL